jgi:hypothetical protein
MMSSLLPWREHPAAYFELREAAFWYDDEEVGLGARFTVAVDEAIGSACEWPNASPLYRGRPHVPPIRRHRVEGFPFGVIHVVKGGTLVVVAYAHERRRPGYWRGRLAGI